MEKAYEIGPKGKQSLVYANKLDNLYHRNISYREKRFVCRECGEYVTYVHRTKYNSFFRHQNKEIDNECMLRRSSHATGNIYERKGPLLILCKSTSTEYSLMMRFTGVKEELLVGTKYSGSTLCIGDKSGDKKSKYRIDHSRFIPDASSYLDISFSAERYYIHYSPSSVEKDYSKKWGKEAEGFQCNRILFSCIGEKGYKIRVNDEIELNVPYFVATTRGKELERKRFIESSLMGLLKLNEKPFQYLVYKIIMRADSDADFKEASQYVRDKFKVNLVHQKTEVDLIWPPAARGVDEINYFGRIGDALYRIRYGKKTERINVYQGRLNNTYRITSVDSNTQSLRVPISNKNELMCLGENNTTLLYYLSNRRFQKINRIVSKVTICDVCGNNLKGLYETLPQDATVNVSASIKSEILLIRNGIFYSSYKLNDDRTKKIQGLRYGDTLFWKYQMTLEKLVEFRQKEMEYKQSDALVTINDIERLSRTPNVPCKPWVRKLLLYIDMEARLQVIMKNYIRNGKIPIGVERLLYRKYCEMRDDIR